MPNGFTRPGETRSERLVDENIDEPFAGVPGTTNVTSSYYQNMITTTRVEMSRVTAQKR